NRTFDLIECSGVLHHMDDPMKGWQILVHLLRPGGFINIGLYSRYARKHIVAAGSFVQERGYKPTVSDIRKCRKELLSQPDNSILKKVTDSRDFYSISGTRNLIFHTRECHFTIPQISDALNEFRLSFLGFHFEDKTIVKKYLNRFPDDPYAVSLSNWNEFEMQTPDTFRHMYRFWTQKTPGLI
ncbi:MAG: class I SAM-dependent methyltransferase, partial [Desulfobulbaceae bacterium]|nr:class I SAM-dependent methyltransferase [Desulfobulbaceae bacterium]